MWMINSQGEEGQVEFFFFRFLNVKNFHLWEECNKNCTSCCKYWQFDGKQKQRRNKKHLKGKKLQKRKQTTETKIRVICVTWRQIGQQRAGTAQWHQLEPKIPSGLDKYILDKFWTNTSFNLDKYILRFGQIHLAIWTNKSCNLDKFWKFLAGTAQWHQFESKFRW